MRLIEATRGSDRTVTCWQGEPAAWRDYAGSYGERQRLKPDAFVAVAGPGFLDESFVEIDMGTQSTTVLRRKLATYVSYAATGTEQAGRGGIFPRVVFVAPDSARAAVIAELVAALPAEHTRLFAVATTESATAVLLGGAS